jgi:hypothetical protein
MVTKEAGGDSITHIGLWKLVDSNTTEPTELIGTLATEDTLELLPFHLRSTIFPSGHYLLAWIKFANYFDRVNHLQTTISKWTIYRPNGHEY